MRTINRVRPSGGGIGRLADGQKRRSWRERRGFESIKLLLALLALQELQDGSRGLIGLRQHRSA